MGEIPCRTTFQKPWNDSILQVLARNGISSIRSGSKDSQPLFGPARLLIWCEAHQLLNSFLLALSITFLEQLYEEILFGDCSLGTDQLGSPVRWLSLPPNHLNPFFLTMGDFLFPFLNKAGWRNFPTFFTGSSLLGPGCLSDPKIPGPPPSKKNQNKNQQT